MVTQSKINSLSLPTRKTTGWDNATAAENESSVPAAQSGVQTRRWNVPTPTASCDAQSYHLIPVTYDG